MASPERFRAFRLHQDAPGAPVAGRFVTQAHDELPPGELLVRVAYTSINYKDALAAAGLNQIVRQYPRTGGIDFSGRVEHSSDPRFAPGDAVVVHGFGVGVDHDGGHAEFARVRADWALALPEGLTLLEAATLGAAGYTAALCVHWMEHNGLAPGGLPVVVTGATGGVASVAIDILAGRGHEVVAVSGKGDADGYLRALGAATVLDTSVAVPSGRPLDKGQWAGAVDSVGGEMLAWLLRSAAPDAVLTSLGNAGGAELHTTVLPLILRGVRLIGINANSPMALRRTVWARLAGDLRPRHLARIARMTAFDQLPEAMARMRERATRGRLVVAMA
ncbi:acryloyl-CoA reductase [Pseudorhodoferax sp. Leaf274]|uniref:acrylyl-CoA reductase family protein n=1 Tax=Pseudorhodoferax sp. Leaf274 TaxID=1736318 RepID=UPI000702BCCF|nr:acryloyl-CoA reductase [Pseudorhodoferax sp. Leaf274]KQP44626.1 zinc-binding dehydrogenase [Pseudorhodoferax sp. Leaf274]